MKNIIRFEFNKLLKVEIDFLLQGLSFVYATLFLIISGSFYHTISAQESIHSSLGAMDQARKTKIENNLQSLPVNFRKNRGQWSDNILFESASSGIHMYFMKDGISYLSARENESESTSVLSPSGKTGGDRHDYLVWNMNFIGCNKNVSCTSEGEHMSNINYLIGDDPSRYVLNARDYEQIQYHELYDKIDLRYYSSGTKIEYDYIIKPGGRMEQIKMAFSGVKKIRIKRDGILEVKTEWGTTADLAPYSYQVINGIKTEVDIRYYLLNDTTIGFYSSTNINPAYDLIIDPVVLYYSTYVGAAASANITFIWGYIFDIASDKQGNAYVTGWYEGGGFPTKPGNYDGTWNGANDVFVFKLKPDGTDIVYGTYIGGNGRDKGVGIAVDDFGCAYITGDAESPNFPTTAGAYDPTYNGPFSLAGNSSFSGLNGPYGPFVLKLNAAGTGLVYSTFLGYAGLGCGVAVNNKGEAFVTGSTLSSNFPVTPGAYDTSFNGGLSDIFVSKLSSDGSALLYSTFIGGSTDQDRAGNMNVTSSEIGFRNALDPMDNVYVAGWTSATDFPVSPGCFDPSYNSLPGVNQSDALVLKLSMNGNGNADLKYSTYLGGTYGDLGNDISVNSAGDAFVIGNTSSSSFPTTAGVYDPTYNGPVTSGPSNPFIVRLNPQGTTLKYSTFIGAGYGMSIQINDRDEAYSSVAYPSSVPLNGCSYNNNKGGGIALYKLNDSGKKLLFSGMIGGSGVDADFATTQITLVKYDCKEDLIMTNTTHSSDFPVTAGAFQTAKLNLNGGSDQPVISRFTQNMIVDFNAGNAVCNTPVNFNNTTTGEHCGILDSVKTWLWDFGDGNFSSSRNPSHTYANAGTYNVKLIAICPGDTLIKALTVTGSCCALNIVAAKTDISCYGSSDGSVSVNTTGGNGVYSYQWSTGSTANNISGLSSGLYTVTAQDGNGCKNTATIMLSNPDSLSLSFTTSCAVNGSASVTVTGGKSPYTYLWNNPSGQTSTTASNLGSGTYTITIRDISGCLKTASVNMNNAIPSLGIMITEPSCSGGTDGRITIIPANGTGPFYYSWNTVPAQNKQSAQNLAPGSYQVTVTGSNGCSITKSIAIGARSVVDVNIPATICPGDSVQLNAVLSGTTDFVSFSCGTLPVTTCANSPQKISLGPVVNPNFSNPYYGHMSPYNTGTDYRMQVIYDAYSLKSAGLQAGSIQSLAFYVGKKNSSTPYTNFTIKIGCTKAVKLPDATNPYKSWLTGLSTVFGPTTYSSITGWNTHNFTQSFHWDGQSNIVVEVCWDKTTSDIADDVSVLQNDTYYNTVTNNSVSGCLIPFATGPTNTSPNIQLGFCKVNPVYSWSPSAGLNNSGISNPKLFISGSASKTYTVTVEGINGCSMTKSITINPNCGTLVFSATGSTICAGGCANIISNPSGGTNPYTYSWSTGATTQNINTCPPITTTYTVKVTDSGGSTSTSTATIIINPSVNVSSTVTNASCNGGTGSVSTMGSGGSLPYSYSWSNNQTAQTITGLTAGNYTVTITDSKGCTGISTAAIISPPPLAGQFTKGTASCAGCGCKEWLMVTGAGGTSPYTYTWSDGYVSRYKNQLCPGAYSINIKDKNGCSVNINLTAP
ncbi:MAG: SBBP repeat-containing protein [Bacteroidetes bacterium]|nr:SBBP repeat-containing protein [Bacteroidota bacterium]